MTTADHAWAKAAIAREAANAAIEREAHGGPGRNGHGPPGPQGRPHIAVTERQLPEISAEALAALVLANNPPQVYVRSGGLVRVVPDEEGRLIIAALGEDALGGHLSRAADWFRAQRSGSMAPVLPPPRVVRDVGALPSWPGIPPLVGLVFAPNIRPDGSVLDVPGYDPTTRLLYSPAPGLNVPPVASAPGREDVAEAVRIIEDVLHDLPFVSNADAANAGAELLTPIVRSAIAGRVPIAINDTPRAGTGKGLLVDVVSIIATGRPAPKTTAPSSGNEDEWRKLLLGVALDGHPLFVLDNLEGALRSGTLAGFITADPFVGRVLGLNKTVSARNRVVLVATGNNVALAGDLPRRVYWVRMDAKVARPWERETWRHPALLEYVTGERGHLLWAALILARNWWASGCPAPSVRPLGGFEDWTRVIGGILEFAGINGFLGNTRDLYDQMDSSTPEWEGFLRLWHQDPELGEGELLVAAVVEHLGKSEALRAALPDDLPDAWVAHQAGRGSFSRRLGKALAAKADTIYGDLQLQRRARDPSTKHIRWRVAVFQSPNTVPSTVFGGVCGVSNTQPPRALAGARAHVQGLGQTPQTPPTPVESVEQTPPPPSEPCRPCGGSAWWWGPGGWTCANCHPNPAVQP